MRYEVRIEELDASFDIGRVWAPSEEEAIRLALDFIDYVDRRPLYDRPVSATEIGSTPDPEDLGQASTWEAVYQRRVSADGRVGYLPASRQGEDRRPHEGHAAVRLGGLTRIA